MVGRVLGGEMAEQPKGGLRSAMQIRLWTSNVPFSLLHKTISGRPARLYGEVSGGAQNVHAGCVIAGDLLSELFIGSGGGGPEPGSAGGRMPHNRRGAKMQRNTLNSTHHRRSPKHTNDTILIKDVLTTGYRSSNINLNLRFPLSRCAIHNTASQKGKAGPSTPGRIYAPSLAS